MLARVAVRRVKRVWRILCGRELWVRRDLRVPLERFGGDGAGWRVDRSRVSCDSIIYSFGIGEDVSFDLALIEATGARIYAFDPTPRALNWCATQKLPPEFCVKGYALGATDGEVVFHPPSDPNHVSHSIINRSGAEGIVVPVRRLTTIMRELGHERIDLLKIDIEGSEYDVIDDLVGYPILPAQLLIEFHHRWPELGVARTRQALARLRAAGYRIAWVSETGEEYTFLRAGA